MGLGRLALVVNQTVSSAVGRLAIARSSRRTLPLVIASTMWLTACGSAPVSPGFYRVQRGDTLSVIARDHQQSAADLARWNHLSNPNQIDVDQVLRVTPPEGEPGLRTRESTETSTAASSTPRSSTASRAAAASRARPAPSSGAVVPPPTKTIALAWPAVGKITNNFDGNRNKGIDIAGQKGDAVKAAAPGQVAYVGQLRGYGNLLIIKHKNGFLTSYAHLQNTIVKEGQTVSTGQNIASLGDTETSRPMLHFEVRYDGQPVNPAKYLPTR